MCRLRDLGAGQSACGLTARMPHDMRWRGLLLPRRNDGIRQVLRERARLSSLIMSMFTLIVGALLFLLGILAYAATGGASLTALIPSAFGLIYGGLGALGVKRAGGPRRHAMHAAAVLSLIGILGNLSAVLSLPALIAGESLPRPAATIARAVMALICAVHLAAAIRSFVLARVINKPAA